MGGLFSKSRHSTVTDTDRAILSLKTQKRKLTEYSKRIETVIASEVEAAKQLLQEKKRERALIALKKKKIQEDLLRRVEEWMMNVEQMLLNIESAQNTRAVFDSLKTGHAAIKELEKEMNVEDIQKILDDTAEAREYQEEVNRVLGNALSDEQQEAIAQELEDMEAQMVEAELPAVPTTALPQPTKQASPQKAETREEKAAVAHG
eukprot:jgi/Mesvir1/19466/Mv10490-RA.1